MTTSVRDIDNRQRILEAAEQLFAAQGFSATSVREIVQAASVTPPVLYYYFGSKEELLLTLLDERLDEFVKNASMRLSSARSAAEVVEGWCCSLLAEAVSRPMTFRFVSSAVWGPKIPQALNTVLCGHRKMMNTFAEHLSRVASDLDKNRTHFVFQAIHGLLNSYIFALIEQRTSTDGDDILAAVVPRLVSMLDDDFPIPDRTLEEIRALSEESVSKSAATTRGSVKEKS